jgi:Family of unknown function (DUF5908)
MPIEIHELVIRAVIDPQSPRTLSGLLALDPQELQRLKREIAAECLAHLRDELAARTDR